MDINRDYFEIFEVKRRYAANKINCVYKKAESINQWWFKKTHYKLWYGRSVAFNIDVLELLSDPS